MPVGNGAPPQLLCINHTCPASTFGATEMVPCDGRIELAFDRLLLPITISRQTFPVRDLSGNAPTPNVAYDPVARVVTLSTPKSDGGNCWLTPGQTYRVAVLPPMNAGDLNGLRAIDGTFYAPPPDQPNGYEFMVAPAAGTPAPPSVDFCKDILPVFQSSCSGSICHGLQPPLPGPYTTAAGLVLTSNVGVAQTAIGRVSQGSNTGPRAGTGQPPSLLFNEDVPIIDPGTSPAGGGDPGHSWLMYKLLLSTPPAPEAGAPPQCAGTDVSGAHLLPIAQLQSMWVDEHATLSDLVLGREMPFPPDPTQPLGASPVALTLDQLERVSRWIAQPYQGSPVPATCSSCGP